MNSKIKVAVIGGTGKSGKYLVQELINRQIHFRLLVRNSERASADNPYMEVIHGNVKDVDTIHSLIRGCTAVISTLGMGVPISEPTIFSQSTTNVIHAMKAHNITRYIVITGLNVDTPSDKKSMKTQQATDWMKSSYPKSTADKQMEFRMLSESNIDWTLVRLPLIDQTIERRELKISLEDCMGDKISATDLAHFLVDQLFDKNYLCTAPFVANG
jgi:putative NADH-flavin reductase